MAMKKAEYEKWKKDNERRLGPGQTTSVKNFIDVAMGEKMVIMLSTLLEYIPVEYVINIICNELTPENRDELIAHLEDYKEE